MEVRLTNSRILITGGAGFIGSNLCKAFLDQNNQVICLDNFETGKEENISDFLSNPNFTLIRGDIRNVGDCTEAVKGCDYVFHQAALGSVPRSINDPVSSTDVNIGGFVKMLFAAHEAKVKRFVYAASSSTYGDSKDLPKVEHKIGKALSPYGITKFVDELFAQNFSEIYGIETIGLRYFNVFGRRQDPDGAYAAVIPKFVRHLMRLEAPRINGDGNFSRDFTYIDNVVRANELAALVSSETIKENQKRYHTEISDAAKLTEVSQERYTINETFNVACGQRTNLNELFGFLKDGLSNFNDEIRNIEPEYGPNRFGDIPHSLASVKKAETILGYKPLVRVEEGLQQCVEWYWENYQ